MARGPPSGGGAECSLCTRKKGPTTICDNSRGILLADHSGKGLTALIKNKLDPDYTANIPSNQYGAVALKGTDFASHVVRSAISHASRVGASILVLFLDLVKAFDKAIRQLVYGWGPVVPPDPVAELVALGVTPKAAAWMARYIEQKGHVLEQWGADPKAVELAQSLHANAWIGVGEGSTTAVTSRTGGRQGCKLGALTFNCDYSIALGILTVALAEADIVMRTRVPSGPFWEPPDEQNVDFESVVDVAFVDDEAIVILARNAGLLDKAMRIVLEVLTEVFGNLHLELNWQPGKSECLLKYRGKHAVQHREQWRTADGSLRIPVPNHENMFLSVVQHYKHLGTYTAVTTNGDTFKNTQHRVSSALAAYAPIACKVFGAASMTLLHRLAFMRSLILSRLLFGLHITIPSPRDIKALNGVYMRVLRRIGDQVRCSAENEMTDIQVRIQLGQPSVDCLLCRARLRYAARLARNRPRAILAILHMKNGAASLPWVSLLAADTERLRTCGAVPADLPDFTTAPQRWHDLMCNASAWDRAVSDLFFSTSCCDTKASHTDQGAEQYHCSECDASFCTDRAKQSHERAKHGKRIVVKDYLPSAVCPSCGTDFQQRLRCIAHVSDKRRTSCREWILINCTPITHACAALLDEVDKVARRTAQRQGLSHPVAYRTAVRNDGRSVGRLAT
jgi:hypothetical protein